MRREARAETLILVARALCESIAVAAAAAALHALLAARAPIGLLGATAALFGTTLVVTALLRERGTAQRSAALTAAVVTGAVAVSFVLPARPPDALGVLTRILVFGLLGEAYLWRLVTLARGPLRWRDVRRGTYLALGALGAAALLPGPIDRDPLPALALVAAMCGGVGMSLARSTEELSFGTHQIAGRPAGGAATGAAFVIGSLAIAVAAFLPAAQALAGDVSARVGPLIGDALFLILLPLGYVAAWVVYLVLWLREALGIGPLVLPQPPQSPVSDDDLLRRLREMDAQRPLVFGAVEALIALIGLAVAIVLIARLVEERRARAMDGVDIEREATEAIGLRATLRHLLPRRAARVGAPVDDGTRASRIRRLYWRLLEVAEKDGPGRRVPAETPAEHERRLRLAGDRWNGASEIVRAFEDVRYGETEPDDDVVARAIAALRRVEAAT